MSGSTISTNKWEEYLNELYEWISEKYNLYLSKEIEFSDYEKHLSYYNSEKKRIEDIISSKNIPDETSETKNKSKFTQQTFEEFFGVTIEGDNTNSRIKETINPIIAKMSETSVSNENYKSLNDEKIKKKIETMQVSEEKINENIWRYVEEEKAKSFDISPFDQKSDNQLTSIHLNILLIGDSSVGRTSIRRAWMGKNFIKNHLTTIGASIEKKTIILDDWKYYITLTDLGGQDFYSDLRKNFYRNIDGAIIVFDLTRIETFRRIEYWIKEFYRNSKKIVPFIIIGNKADDTNRQISSKNGSQLAEKFSKMTMPKFKVRYIETSAKSSINIDQTFNIICREIKSYQMQLNRNKVN